MRYDNIRGGRFITRLNRFEAAVEIDGREQLCHVKLLVPGAAVFVQVQKKVIRPFCSLSFR